MNSANPHHIKHLMPAADIESRREHERYPCHDLGIRYCRIGPGQAAANQTINHAQLSDISLKGLSIKSSHELKQGDILSLEIEHHESSPAEVLTAVIMWCQSDKKGGAYQAGLRVVRSSKPLQQDMMQDTISSNQNQLVCPSCHETSFFLREITTQNEKADIYHCCRCGHHHPITDVMTFNRQLSQ